MNNKSINIIYWVVTTFFFILFWTQVWGWSIEEVGWYGIIGSGVAANGAFIGNIAHTIITKNEEYKMDHNGEDMPFVKSIKTLFNIK